MDETEEKRIYKRIQNYHTQTEDKKEYSWTDPKFYDLEHGPFALIPQRRLLYLKKLDVIQEALRTICQGDIYNLKGKKVIDVGAGTGSMSVPFATWGMEVVTVDKDEGFSRMATGKLAYMGGKGVAANAYELPFPDGTFDIVLSTNFWDTGTMTRQNREKAIQEMIRVSKPDAHMITLVRNGDNPLIKKMGYGTFTHKENLELHKKMGLELTWYKAFAIPSPWPGMKKIALATIQKIPGKKYKSMVVFVSRKKSSM